MIVIVVEVEGLGLPGVPGPAGVSTASQALESQSVKTPYLVQLGTAQVRELKTQACF